jgi:hypothetical protein
MAREKAMDSFARAILGNHLVVTTPTKAALKRPHSRRFASDEAWDIARQRLKRGRFSAAFTSPDISAQAHLFRLLVANRKGGYKKPHSCDCSG